MSGKDHDFPHDVYPIRHRTPVIAQPVEIELTQHHIEAPGEPKPKARARFAKGRTYTDKKTVEHEQHLASFMAQVVKEPLTAGVGIDVVFYKSNLQRVDVDNLMKGVLDAATGVIWVDDSQVVRLSGRIEFDAANPRTVIDVQPERTSLPRGTDVDVTKTCPTCGNEFTTRAYKSKPHGAIFCSKTCHQQPPAVCQRCGKEYRKNSSAQLYCSKKCAAQFNDARRRVALAEEQAVRELPNCQRCGVGLKQRGAVMCRACWLSRGPDGMKGVKKADLKKAA